jgi:hypothetical protein
MLHRGYIFKDVTVITAQNKKTRLCFAMKRFSSRATSLLQKIRLKFLVKVPYICIDHARVTRNVVIA